MSCRSYDDAADVAFKAKNKELLMSIKNRTDRGLIGVHKKIEQYLREMSGTA